MISVVELFTFSDERWDQIRTVVRKAFNLDADQIVLQGTSMDGTTRGVTLRAKIERTAFLHIARDRAMRSLPTQFAFSKHLTDLRSDAKRLHDRIVASPAFWFAHNDYKPDNDMLAATDAYFEKLGRNLDGIITAIGPPRRKTGSDASKNMGRDLFWSEVRGIWCTIGGKKTGVDAADFLIAVSLPVFSSMPPGAQDAVPDRPSVIQWLRRH
jgi:hypothetical protein